MGQILRLDEHRVDDRDVVRVLIRGACRERDCYVTVFDPHKGVDSCGHARDGVSAVIHRLRTYALMRRVDFKVEDHSTVYRFIPDSDNDPGDRCEAT